MSAEFNSIIISAETRFNVQSAAVQAEGTSPTSLNIWSTAPGGVVEITKVAVGGRGAPGEQGDPGQDGDDATVNTDATLTGTGATGLPLGVADGGVNAAKLASGAVTNAKIGSNAVSSAKIANNAVTTAKTPPNTPNLSLIHI